MDKDSGSTTPRPGARATGDRLPKHVDPPPADSSAFWSVFDARFPEIMETQRRRAEQDPAARSALAGASPEQQEKVFAAVHHAMHQALAEGDWTEYDNLQKARAQGFARGGLPVISWYRLVTDLQHIVRPFLLEAYAADDERLAEAYAGLTEFITRTVALIADEYVQAKEATISSQEQTLLLEAADRERAERDYRLLFESHPQPMLVYDPATLRIIEVNHASVALYGYAAEEFREMRIGDLHSLDDPDELLQQAAQAPLLNRAGPWRQRKKDGTFVDVSSTSHAVVFHGQPARVVMFEDVTERENLERQHRLAQRMESLGQLAGGVAHDFNNLLGAIINYAAFVKEEVGAAAADDPEHWEPVEADVAQIESAAERAARLVHQLLSFARQEVARPEVVNINDAVMSIELLLRRTLGEHIQLSTVLAPDLVSVKIDSGQLEQVLVNLAVNARDAMPGGGRLTIDTENLEVDDDYAATRPGVLPGRYVRLRVSDTGTGMDSATLQRAFEPFFTTKPKGEGTGLGLASVYGIVTQAGGRVQIYSEPGHGTTITALLPATEEARAQASPGQPIQQTGGNETILVVEDEDALREVTRRILARNGYQVITAARGAEALQVMTAPGPAIELLVTDVVMPEMLGTEVAERARALRPGIRVLYISGYAQTVLGSQGTVDADVVLLEKPFSEPQLLAHVREVLDSGV
jgi:PAS domain S-box-containing protein